MSRDELKTILLFGARARAERTKKWQVATPLEPWDMFIRLLLNAWTLAWMVCGLLNVCYYYKWLYAWARLDWSPCMYMICLVALHISWCLMPRCTPHLVILHVSCYSTSHENQDFHGKFLNFAHEYLRVTMHGLPRVSKVTLEQYRKCVATHSPIHFYKWSNPCFR